MTQNIKAIVKEFSDLFSKGLEHITKAAEIYVDTIKKYPESILDFHKCISLNRNSWDRIEQVGNHVITAELLFLTEIQAKRLSILTIEHQKRMLSKKIPVIKVNPNTQETVIVKKLLDDMTEGEFNRAFDKTCNIIKPEDQIKNLGFALVNKAWEVVGNRLIVHRATVITVNDLWAILDQVDNKLKQAVM